MDLVWRALPVNTSHFPGQPAADSVQVAMSAAIRKCLEFVRRAHIVPAMHRRAPLVEVISTPTSLGPLLALRVPSHTTAPSRQLRLCWLVHFVLVVIANSTYSVLQYRQLHLLCLKLARALEGIL